MMPSISAVIMPSARRLRIGWSDVNRDRMSPICRFSKKEVGSRIRWRNSRAPRLEVQGVLHDEQHQRADRAGGDAHQHEKAEAQRQHDEKIDVAAGDDLVDRDLHVERRGQHQDLQHRPRGRRSGPGRARCR